MREPVVSILIPTLDAASTLGKALDAILAQTLSREEGAVEVIVADGGSKDDTRAIARAHGATVLENPRVLPEYGLSVAMAAARGRYAIFQGADAIMTDPHALATKARLLGERPRLHNVLFGGLVNPAGYPGIGDYVNRFGDPFSLFMYRLDAGDNDAAFRTRYRLEEDAPEYSVFDFDDGDVLPLVDGGNTFRLERLRQLVDVTDASVVSRVFSILVADEPRLAVAKKDLVVHYSTSEYATAWKKCEWRVINNVHHVRSGAAGFSSREKEQPRAFRMKKYLFLPYALSVAAPAVDAALLAARYKNPAMLYHLPLTVKTGLAIVKHVALKAMGRSAPQRAYGK